MPLPVAERERRLAITGRRDLHQPATMLAAMKAGGDHEELGVLAHRALHGSGFRIEGQLHFKHKAPSMSRSAN